ncbi:MAG: RNA polymerase sigma factor [Planctomycetota bacterium]|jgi:RNA polymerase sigma-70 factor (ECF subfamily)|nr:RNA polymerase sigma factor [Planctomycetota bacterium]
MEDADAADRLDVEKTLAGDHEAFSRLVERHGQAIHQRMRGFSRDESTGEELAQDVFVEAFAGLASYRGDAPFRNWLARIATFVGYKYWREREKRKKEIPLPEGWDPPAAAGAEPEPGDPEAAADLLHALLAALPEKDRLLLTLAYVQDCSTGEIAEQLGVSRALVPMRVFKAKLKLRRLAGREPWKGKIKWLIS